MINTSVGIELKSNFVVILIMVTLSKIKTFARFEIKHLAKIKFIDVINLDILMETKLR